MNWLEEAKVAREKGSLADALEFLERARREKPNDPQVHYQIAWTHDALGKERDAVPAYEEAIRLGLQGDDLAGAYLGLGSTYRALGEYEKSFAVLESGMALFPDRYDLRAFYALTLFNLGRAPEAMEILLKALAETSSDAGIQAYRKALLFYSDKLSSTFD